MNQYQILSDEQLGFRKGNRTSDAHIILKNVIDDYCHRSNKRVFGCFVDFQKAFDSIPRHKLFEKLRNKNITGDFYNTLIDIYSNDKFSIRIGETMTTESSCNQGVKQGCVLSPTLFNIFLSDLPKLLMQDKNKPISIDENTNLSCLIWADDLLILSKTEEGLRNMLKDLETYSSDNGIKLNLEKTKCMIFNKTGKHIRRLFTFFGERIETTRTYKYLGFIVTPSGEINTGLRDLKDRAMRGYRKLKFDLGYYFLEKPLLTTKLFESLIKPIIMYCSDFWGCLKLRKKNNPLELVQNKFCKDILGVHKNTANTGARLEMGKLPLSLHAKSNGIKNWERILAGTTNILLLKSYLRAKNISLPWIESIRNSLSLVGLYEQYRNPTLAGNK